ncbi:tachykinin-like peptides receptor 86C [Pollicipes pollicipes]|uniref:tachykinin-like peptides receptor 86C n=1 Tax=Pollicipes pollicipes TaxID=41117 RepID=UPI001885915B|nr:tachykinin-like peptides receptor 86C [Pollicipes pollicipes]
MSVDPGRRWYFGVQNLRLLLEHNVGAQAGARPDGFAMASWAALGWAVAFGAMLVIAIAGNSLVCAIILTHRHMRTATNCFLVNLSVANLLMICLNCTFNFIYVVYADWWFGLPFCIISNFVSSLTVTASVFSLVAVSIERYMVIVRPLRRKIRRGEVVGSIILIWVCSGCLSVPYLLYSDIITHRRLPSGDEVCGCVLVWPDGLPQTSFADHVYSIVFLCLTYILPMLFMAICYTIIGRQLWRSGRTGFKTTAELSAIRSRRKIARKFIVVVVAFALLWLPHQASCVYTYHDSWLARRKYVQHLFLGFYWLAMSHSMVNPFIYFWMNGRFRSCLAGWCGRSDKHAGMYIKVHVLLAGMTPAALPTGKRELMLKELGV